MLPHLYMRSAEKFLPEICWWAIRFPGWRLQIHMTADVITLKEQDGASVRPHFLDRLFLWTMDAKNWNNALNS